MADTNSSRILLTPSRIVGPQETVENAVVLIEDGRIVSINPKEFGTDVDVIDLSDCCLYPGFIDVHIHGAVGVDTMEADADGLIRVSNFLATKGVTGWLPTFVPASADNYARATRAIEEATTRSEGARILGVHYEGPFVNLTQCGALRTQFFRTYSSPTNLDLLPLGRADLKHMITIAPEIEGGLELVRELKQRGWIISIGHTRAEVEILNHAFEAGARHMTHFMNAMPQLHHRAPGPVGWGLATPGVTLDMIADGIHLEPYVLKLLLELKGAGSIALISDAIAATGRGDGQYRIWDEEITVRDGRTQNERGSIAGSVITMLDAVRLLASLGVEEVDLARMASTNPARLLGIDDECGTLEEGKRADLVALDHNGKVKLTLVGGERQTLE